MVLGRARWEKIISMTRCAYLNKTTGIESEERNATFLWKAK